ILQERGPVMQREDLFRIARTQGVSEAVVERGLSNSNVVVRLAKETYGLIGSSLGTVEPTLECSTPLCRKLFITRIAYYDIRGEPSSVLLSMTPSGRYYVVSVRSLVPHVARLMPVRFLRHSSFELAG